jgi:hypothetical protein
VTRARNAYWGLCQAGMALAIISAARAVVTTGRLAEELTADEASVLVFSGYPAQALDVLERITGGDARTRVVRAIAAAPALAVTGRTADAVRTAQAGYAEHVALGDELALAHPAMHLVNQVFALAEAGRLAEAEKLAQEGAEMVAAQRVPMAQIFAASLGRVATLQGRVATARRYYAEAAGLAEANRFAGPRRLALAGLALAQAMLGDADAAALVLAERDTGPEFGFRGPEQQLADAWTAIASGQPVTAAERSRVRGGRRGGGRDRAPDGRDLAAARPAAHHRRGHLSPAGRAGRRVRLAPDVGPGPARRRGPRPRRQRAGRRLRRLRGARRHAARRRGRVECGRRVQPGR